MTLCLGESRCVNDKDGRFEELRDEEPVWERLRIGEVGLDAGGL